MTMTGSSRTGRIKQRKLAMILLTAFAVLVAFTTPASASSQGYIEAELGVGYFYGTFGESPNVVLLVGGTAEEFCEDNPEDPFSAEPGSAPGRIFLRDDGSVDIKVNDKNQPIYLYNTEIEGAPPWIGQTCAAYFGGQPTPNPFATGTADLKVRVSVMSENLVDVFNSVNGKATGTDGTEYTVRASADLVVENGVPVGNPADFIELELKVIGR